MYYPLSWFLLYFVFFFFKQKTAYEMRISDWSSDVCSSDLVHPGIGRWRHDPCEVGVARRRPNGIWRSSRGRIPVPTDHAARKSNCRSPRGNSSRLRDHGRSARANRYRRNPTGALCKIADRSEEHTSELQSLMRISYAVFSL